MSDIYDDDPAPRGGLWSGGDRDPDDGEPGRADFEERDSSEWGPDSGWNRPDPRERPRDPAGSFPRHEPRDLLPRESTPLTAPPRMPSRPAGAVASGGGAGGATVASASTGELPEPPQAARFQFVLGGLIALAIAGLVAVGLVAALGGNDTKATSDGLAAQADNWSNWRPVAGGDDGPTQIADHVGQEYKLDNGSQIVAVTGGPLAYSDIPLQVALRQAPSQGGSIKIMEGTGVLYRLCGLGKNCSISAGKPSTARHLLLRREALELALYSFRYLQGVSQVVVFMPPAPNAKSTDLPQALYFRPQDVAAELGKPLARTLSPQTPTVSSILSSPDSTFVNQLTEQQLFNYQLSPSNTDASGFLVLQKTTS